MHISSIYLHHRTLGNPVHLMALIPNFLKVDVFNSEVGDCTDEITGVSNGEVGYSTNERYVLYFVKESM